MIGYLLERHDAEPVQGRAFTPHGALLRGSGSSACRSPRGSAPRPTGAAGARRLRPPPPRLPAAHRGRPISDNRFAPPGSTCCTPGTAAMRSRESLPFGFHLDAEAAAQHLASQLRDRADEHNVALIEQCDAVANALHPLEQVRRQQHAHALVFEIADDIEQLGGGLRIEARRRLVEDRDLRLLHQDLGKPEPLAHAAREGADPFVRNVRRARHGRARI